MGEQIGGMRFEALGSLVVLRDGEPVSIRPAQRKLLAAFLVTPETPLSVDVLIDRMWGDDPPATASRALHVHLSGLRRGVPDAIIGQPGGYRIDLDRHELDVLDFVDVAVEATQHLADNRIRDAVDSASQAERLWRGDPFPELADVMELRGERERLVELHLAVRTTKARALTLQGRITDAIGELSRLVAEHPLNEPLWEELTLAYYLSGRIADARETIAAARLTLQAELDLDVGPRLQDLERRVAQRDPALASRTPPATTHNIPILASTFVERETELADVVAAVMDHPLVTITGPPGIGKTRLAVEASTRLLGDYPAGVWLVRLAEVTTRTDVLATVASVLTVENLADDPERLYRAVAQRPALLVLDSCEHVLEAIRDFLGHRHHGDRLRVLATSRERLALDGEAVIPLGPLTVPETEDVLWESGAIRLLSDRVGANAPGVDLHLADPGVLLSLCRRTDGMPLALELAARRLAFLDEVRAAEIDFADRGSSGPMSPEPVAVGIGRSVDALQPEHQDMFDAASVFAAPFTIDAFANVCVRRADPTLVDESLSRLAEMSLLRPERVRSGALRYRMLEPLRDVGRRRLRMARRVRATRDRHAAWFASVADRIASAEWSAAERQALDEAEETIADLRQAMRHLLDTGRSDAATELAASLAQFWISRFQAWEGHRWLAECLAHDQPPQTRLKALGAASALAFFIGDYNESAAQAEQALELAIELDNRQARARALYGIGRVLIHRDPPRGSSYVERAIADFEALGDDVAAAECRVALGIQAAHRGDRASADALLMPATALLEAEQYPRIAAVGHRHLSLAAWHDGHEAAARHHADLAVACGTEAHDSRVLAGALASKAMAEARWGDQSRAATIFVQSLRLTAGQHEIYFVLTAIGALEILIRSGAWDHAARLLAHFEHIHHACGWISIDQRYAQVAGYRARIDAGLARHGIQPNLSPVPTDVMADELVRTLGGIADPAPTVAAPA